MNLPEEIGKRPRHVGAGAALGILVWRSLETGLSGWTTFAVAAAWLIGSVVGGYSLIIASLLAPRHSDARRRKKTWAGVLAGGWCTALVVAAVLEGSAGFVHVAELLVLPTCALYFFCKLGCLKFCCCGWSGRFSRLGDFLPLQLLEALISLLLALVALVFVGSGAPPRQSIALFVTIHGLQRILSRSGRGLPATRILLKVDSGCLVTIGVLLWITAS